MTAETGLHWPRNVACAPKMSEYDLGKRWAAFSRLKRGGSTEATLKTVSRDKALLAGTPRHHMIKTCMSKP